MSRTVARYVAAFCFVAGAALLYVAFVELPR